VKFYENFTGFIPFILPKNGYTDIDQTKGGIVMLDRISLLLVIVGALNWGSIGLFRFDLVSWICGGQDSIFARIIYTLVALAGIWCISLLFRPRETEYSSNT